MLTGLDTSVVLRLVTGEPKEQSQAAWIWLSEWLRPGGTATVSDLVVAEVYHALQYHYGVSKKDALGALFRMFLSRTVLPAGQAAKVLLQKDLATAKPGFVDRLIHAAYTAPSGKMVTFEKSGKTLQRTILLT
jgi:predicted nucleic-acid-binding protein